jgi:aminoglycoside phosphotransferase (APT) family kinase protein
MMHCHQSVMTNSEPRCAPFIEIEFEQIQALLAPVLQDAAIISIERIAGGLVNTLYRVRTVGDTFCLRIFAMGRRGWETERRILAQVAKSLPVPEVLLDGDGQHPYLVYRWIEGITLDECRRQMPPAALLSLAEPLGRALAVMAGLSWVDLPVGELIAVQAGSFSVEAALATSEVGLRRGLVRQRLGAAFADVLWHRLETQLETRTEGLTGFAGTVGLVHGDLGGRNILVAPADNGDWRISGLIDWEKAFCCGSPVWDMGRLFRYPKRYSEAFRQRFERAYCAAGGTLPEDWWRIARLLDATQLIAILNEEQELPLVFAECRELLEALVADWR